MVRRKIGQSVQQEFGMSLADLSRLTGGMVHREQDRSGTDREAATCAVARRARLSVGTVGNVIRRRVKDVAASVRDRLVSAAIADITNEITRLEHDRQMLVQMGACPRSDDMDALDGALATARAAIERMRMGL